MKDDAILLLVCRRWQFLFSMFLILGRFSLNVVLNLMRLLSVLSFSVSSSFLLTDLISLGYPRSMKLVLSVMSAFSKSALSVHIFLARRACPNGMLSLSDIGW